MRLSRTVLVMLMSILSVRAFAQQEKKIETKYGTFTFERPYHNENDAFVSGTVITPAGKRLPGEYCGCQINEKACQQGG